MIKKFALMATAAALFVACNSENDGSMENPQSGSAETQEMMDAAEADADVVVAPATTGTEEVVVEDAETPVVEETGTPAVEGAVVVEEEKN